MGGSFDPTEYPFIHHIVEVFATRDGAEQLESGLDLPLACLRLQADQRAIRTKG